MAFLKRWYGATPLHLLAHLVAVFLLYVALSRMWDITLNHVNLVAWLLVGALFHDLLFLPVYVILDLLTRVGIGDHAFLPVRAINYIRVPVVMSGAAFLVYLPLILGDGRENYIKDLGHAPPDYAGRWALLTLGLLLAAALAYVVAVRRAAHAPAPAPASA